MRFFVREILAACFDARSTRKCAELLDVSGTAALPSTSFPRLNSTNPQWTQGVHRKSTDLSTDHYPWCIAMPISTRYSGTVDKTTGKKKPPGAVTQGGFWQGPETGGTCPQLTFRNCESTAPALSWQVMGLLYRLCVHAIFKKDLPNGLLRPETYWRSVHVQPSR